MRRILKWGGYKLEDAVLRWIEAYVRLKPAYLACRRTMRFPPRRTLERIFLDTNRAAASDCGRCGKRPVNNANTLLPHS